MLITIKFIIYLKMTTKITNNKDNIPSSEKSKLIKY